MSLLRAVIATAHRHALTAALLAVAFVCSAPTLSNAQAYPTRPVTIIIPYVPGGAPDAAGRVLAEMLAETLGKPFVADNRPGAGGNIGATAVTTSEPDGYTLLLGATGTLTIGPSIYKNLPFKLTDLTPISLICEANMVMLSAPSMRGKSISEIVDLAKKNPAKANFASSGFGSESHLLIELLKLTTGAPFTHVPYKGFTAGVNDVLSDRVEFMFGSVMAGAPHVNNQKLGALAVAGSKRDGMLADVPTFVELGYPEMQLTSWFGLLAPAKTPQPVLQKLVAAMEKVVRSEEFAARIAKLGLFPMVPGPSAFADRMQADTKSWRDTIVRANIPTSD